MLLFSRRQLPDLSDWLIKQEIKTSTSKYGTTQTDWPEDLFVLRALLFQSENRTIPEALTLFHELDWRFTSWFPRIFSDFRYLSERINLLTGGAEACKTGIEDIISSVDEDPEGYWITNRTDQTSFQFSEHLCQVAFSESGPNYYDDTKTTGEAKHWIFFDNLWASENSDLAESILRYGCGENVLGD